MLGIIKKYYIHAIILIVGFFVGYGVSAQIIPMNNSEVEVREGAISSFTNPLLQCDIGHEYLTKGSIIPFESKVQSLINSEIENKDIDHTSFYFRDLNNGTWFGIGEDEKFRPASLLKVSIMIYYLKLENRNGGVLDKKVLYDGEDLNLTQEFKPSHSVEKGKMYSIWELITYMIKYSDNKATAKLYNMVDGDQFIEMFQLLGIKTPKSLDEQDFISVRQYASFFRILFNASYVGDALSEKALSLLNEVEFSDGIRSTIPDDVKIAHKFGEVTLPTGVKQLHDCGIVYYPKHPYLICVMTKGDDFAKNSQSIQKISKFVYDEVDRQIKVQDHI